MRTTFPDALGRVTTTAINQTTCLASSVTGPAVGGSSPVTSFTYNGFGQVTQTTDPTGLVTQNTYNATNGNLESVIVDPGAGHVASTTLLAYDNAGNITQLTDADGDEAVDAIRHADGSFKEGTFSVTDWSGYPSNVPKPVGPVRLIEGTEYSDARALANRVNRTIHAADRSTKGLQLHEVAPVKFGGSPVDPANKVLLGQSDHNGVTSFWGELQRRIEGY